MQKHALQGHGHTPAHHNVKHKTHMDKVTIKRVKRNKKKPTTEEKILAGLGVGSTLIGGMGAVSAQPPKTQFTTTQNTESSNSTSKVKDTLRKIFGATLGADTAKADTLTSAQQAAAAILSTGLNPDGSKATPAQLNAANIAFYGANSTNLATQNSLGQTTPPASGLTNMPNQVLSTTPTTPTASKTATIPINLLAPNTSFGLGDGDLYTWLQAHPQAATGSVTVGYAADGKTIVSYTIDGTTYSPQQLADAIVGIGQQLSGTFLNQSLSSLTPSQQAIYLLGTTALTLPGSPSVNMSSSGARLITAPTTSSITTFNGNGGVYATNGLNPTELYTPAQAQQALSAVQKYYPNATLMDTTIDNLGGTTNYGSNDARTAYVISYTNTQGQTVTVDVGFILNQLNNGGSITQAQIPTNVGYAGTGVVAGNPPASGLVTGTGIGSVATPTGTVAPVISALSANHGSAGTLITVTGNNFSTTPGNNQVMFSGSTGSQLAVAASSATATSLQFMVPANLAPGTYSVQILNAGNFLATSNSFVFVIDGAGSAIITSTTNNPTSTTTTGNTNSDTVTLIQGDGSDSSENVSSGDQSGQSVATSNALGAASFNFTAATNGEGTNGVQPASPSQGGPASSSPLSSDSVASTTNLQSRSVSPQARLDSTIESQRASQSSPTQNFQGLAMPTDFTNTANNNFTAPAPPAHAAAQNTTTTYTVKAGDSLWSIANKVYGNPRLWRKIMAANSRLVKTPQTLAIGTTLVIPPND